MRINKYISETGYCSRRETDRLINSKRITVNGEICEAGRDVLTTDIVLIDGVPIPKKTEHVYLVLNKPLGITCTAAKAVKGNIIDFVNYSTRIFAVGRLDKASEGLILLTNNGDIVNKMMRLENDHEKEYHVTVNKPITEAFRSEMASGVPILNVITKPCEVRIVNDYEFRIILKQGLNLQIRRMCKALGYRVEKLDRIRIMNIRIDNLQRGKWRALTDDELTLLLGQLGLLKTCL